MGIGNVYGDAFANNGVLTVFTLRGLWYDEVRFLPGGHRSGLFGAAAPPTWWGFEELPASDRDKMENGEGRW